QVRDYEHSVRELARGLEQRRREGFRVALEGFVLEQRTEPLIELADYLKLDVRRLGADGVARQLERIGRRARATVACHVDSSAEFSACAAAGCSHFQGRFLFRPQLLSHKRLPKSLKTVTLLLKRLRDPAIEFAEIDRIVRTDAALAAGVLKLAGSAVYAASQPVTSVVQAVGLVGLREFSKWITVVALTSTSERPSEVSLVALSRARACELVATRLKVDAEAAFLVGLMSALEALFQQPLATLLEELPISAEVRAAVLQHVGPLGKILLDVLSREDEAAPVSTRHQTGLVNRAWLEALGWANETLSTLR
ncbi:MAG TPA: HDOD domain-containing protein, partial [Polyangiaceae bacterium]|nr:HDOD domain-containing protein [Polyangiaceae bacterium]